MLLLASITEHNASLQ